MNEIRHSVEFNKETAVAQDKETVFGLVEKIRKEFSEGNPEAAMLAVRNLAFNRGPEGRSVLESLSKMSDSLGETIQKADWTEAQPDMLQVEASLGLKRFGMLLAHHGAFDEAQLQRAMTYGKSRGYVPAEYDVQDLERIFQTEQVNADPFFDSHLTGQLAHHMFNARYTFGVVEPTYIDLLGPEEVTNLRSQANPRFLLLGTMGRFSSQEMAAFAKKINPESQAVAIDIADHIHRRRNQPSSEKVGLVQADALNLPFADLSVNQIYTNFLLRFMTRKDNSLNRRKKINTLIGEANRVLKPGGSMLLIEGVWNSLQPSDLLTELKDAASRSKLSVTGQLPYVLEYTFRKDSGSAEISGNGFGYYTNSLVEKNTGKDFAFNLKLTKP